MGHVGGRADRWAEAGGWLQGDKGKEMMGYTDARAAIGR